MVISLAMDTFSRFLDFWTGGDSHCCNPLQKAICFVNGGPAVWMFYHNLSTLSIWDHLSSWPRCHLLCTYISPLCIFHVPYVPIFYVQIFSPYVCVMSLMNSSFIYTYFPLTSVISFINPSIMYTYFPLCTPCPLCTHLLCTHIFPLCICYVLYEPLLLCTHIFPLCICHSPYAPTSLLMSSFPVYLAVPSCMCSSPPPTCALCVLHPLDLVHATMLLLLILQCWAFEPNICQMNWNNKFSQ